MAWFAVHESVYGPKLRDMYHRLNCSEFEAVGILNALWSWGLSNAEKDGLLPHTDKDEIARYIYSKSAGCSLDPSEVVDCLIESGWLDEGEKGISIHDWDTWQEQWYKAIERREYDAKRKREIRKRAGELKQSHAQPETPKPEAQPKPEEKPAGGDQPDPPDPPPPKQEEPKYSKDFEEFWLVYPRKIGKGEAYKKYKARLKDGFSPAELLTAATNYAAVCKRKKTEQDYMKHPKTFLSDSTPFVDYIPKETETQPEVPNGANPFERYMNDE